MIMIRKTLCLTFTFALTSAITCLPALAGGLWITEYGQPTQGRAGAGEEAGNGDATDPVLAGSIFYAHPLGGGSR
jgi:hypothetical protein